MILTEINLREAIEKCMLNAEDLISDAILLKQNNRKERAYTLFQLAAEEVGKALQTLFYLLFEKFLDEKNTKKFLKDFRSHKEKTKQAIAMDFQVLLACRKIFSEKIKFIQATSSELKNIDELNNLKNYSLYTSVYKDAFKTPKEIITDSNVETIEFRTLTRFNVTKSYIKSVLPNLDYLRNYMSANPDWSDNTAEKYWEMLEE